MNSSVDAAVWTALAGVRDPELDEPVTELGFVAAVERAGAAVKVRLRLPTYFCAPNFAYLMVADAADAVSALPGVSEVDVALVDHFAAEEINAGMRARRGFAAAFSGLADGDLDELRLTFLRKAHLALQERVAREVQRATGCDAAGLAGVRLTDVPETANLGRLRERRAELGLPAGPDAPLLVDDDGRALRSEELPLRLRYARTVRVSIDANADLCRGLLRSRYEKEGV